MTIEQIASKHNITRYYINKLIKFGKLIEDVDFSVKYNTHKKTIYFNQEQLKKLLDSRKGLKSKLTEKQLDVHNMYYTDKYTICDIANILGCSVNNIYRMLRDIKKVVKSDSYNKV
jgi:DNA-directed RNA polymerase specialized sigma subunit